MPHEREATSVLVVGAGPSGLTMANVLAAAGVPTLVVDRADGPVPESRAALVHVRTLELLDRWGCAAPAIEAGVRLRRVTLRSGGRELARFPLDGVAHTPFPFALALPQSTTERVLLEGACSADRASAAVVEWGTALVGYRPTAAGVTAALRDRDGGPREVGARFLVGADGAGSLVRRVSGTPFPGGAYTPTAFLADVRLEPAPPAGVVDLTLANGGFVGTIDLGAGWCRLFGALSAGQEERFARYDGGGTVPAAELQRWFDGAFQLPARVRDVRWTSIHRLHRRLAGRFRAGDVFLVGDAAHVHAPAGGQGMNLGIGDAVNLGWKLALVHHGAAHDRLLDTYEAERRAVARAVLRGADRGFELEATPNRAAKLLRGALLPAVVGGIARLPVARRAVHELFAQTWISYRGERARPLRDAGRTALRPGDRAPDGPLDAGARAGASLHALLRAPRHHLLLFEGHEPEPDADLDGQAAALRELAEDYRIAIEVHVIPGGSSGRSSGGRGSGNRESHRRYGARSGRVVLVRPDGHIAVISPTMGATAALRRHLDRWYLPAGGGPGQAGVGSAAPSSQR